MHEMSIVAGVMDTVLASAKAAGATRVTAVSLRIGDMTEIVREALDFAFEVVTEGTMCEGAELQVERVLPRSFCLECYNEWEHDRFHRQCPACGSYETTLLAGRELEITGIEVDLPDEPDEV